MVEHNWYLYSLFKYVMQQLQSKMPEIFDLTLTLAKEIQGKGYLSK